MTTDKLELSIAFPDEALEKLQKAMYLTVTNALTDYLSLNSQWCEWTQDGEVWTGVCGIEWEFLDGSPAENDVKFCPKCGKQVEVLGQVPKHYDVSEPEDSSGQGEGE